MDWLWEELQLPELKPKRNTGRRRRRPRARRLGPPRRALPPRPAAHGEGSGETPRHPGKARAVHRRRLAISPDRARGRKPAINAVVIFALDVSGSMAEAERKLAKTFFFFALQGIRRAVRKVETAFLAHATEAWEFTESEFFQTSGTGGTVASSVLRAGAGGREDPLRSFALQRLPVLRVRRRKLTAKTARVPPRRLASWPSSLNYIGYVEIRPSVTASQRNRNGGRFRARCSEISAEWAWRVSPGATTSGKRCAHSSPATGEGGGLM